MTFVKTTLIGYHRLMYEMPSKKEYAEIFNSLCRGINIRCFKYDDACKLFYFAPNYDRAGKKSIYIFNQLCEKGLLNQYVIATFCWSIYKLKSLAVAYSYYRQIIAFFNDEQYFNDARHYMICFFKLMDFFASKFAKPHTTYQLELEQYNADAVRDYVNMFSRNRHTILFKVNCLNQDYIMIHLYRYTNPIGYERETIRSTPITEQLFNTKFNILPYSSSLRCP